MWLEQIYPHSHINYVARTNISTKIMEYVADTRENEWKKYNMYWYINIASISFCCKEIDLYSQYINFIKNSNKIVYWPSNKHEMKILYMIEYKNKIYKTPLYREEMTDFLIFNPYKENNMYPMIDFVYGLDPKIKYDIVEPPILYKLNTDIQQFNENFHTITKNIFCDKCISNIIQIRKPKYSLSKKERVKYKKNDKSNINITTKHHFCTKYLYYYYTNFYIVGSVILKALSKDKYPVTDIDIAFHIRGKETFKRVVKEFIKTYLSSEADKCKILEKTKDKWTVMYKSIKFDLFAIYDSINNVVRKFHLPPARAVYDLTHLYGYASFYYSIYTSTIPWIYISRFFSSKKSIKEVLNKYLNYGCRFMVRPEDKIRYFS